ncbi:MAG: RNA pseudouridine synthase [Myxococcales bacterium]|nr:RNA pseudouridine synthase [Myxococcales bacterium]
MKERVSSARGDPGAITRTFIVDGNEAGLRLDQFLCARIQRLSRNRVQTLIRRGEVDRGEEVMKVSSRVAEGDQIRLWRIPPPEPKVAAWPKVLARGDDWIALDKPGDLTVHPSARYFHHTVTAWMNQQPERFPDARLVHRLDRETSGILLVALGPAADRRLGQAFAKRQVEKEYLALVEGAFPAAGVDCDLALGPAVPPGVIRIKQVHRKDGDPSRTRFRLEQAIDQNLSLVRCFPETGRMHQIRAHLSLLGFPIVGDKIYGSAPDDDYDRFVAEGLSDDLIVSFGAPRQLLHAAALSFPTPEGGRQRIEAKPPEDFLCFGVS